MKTIPTWAWWVAILLLAATGALLRWVPTAPAANFANLPSKAAFSFGEWNCRPSAPHEIAYADPNTDASVAWICGGENEVPVEVYIGYQSGGGGRKPIGSPASHFPEGGAGKWNSELKEAIRVHSVENPDGVFPATLAVIRHSSGRRLLVVYSYRLNQGWLGSDLHYRSILALNRLVRRRSAAAVVRISASIADDKEKVLELEKRLISAILPQVRQYLP